MELLRTEINKQETGGIGKNWVKYVVGVGTERSEIEKGGVK